MKKNKTLKIITLVLAMSLVLSGCGLIPSLDLTESEQKVIAEYAAGLLLKYDRNYSGAIMDIEEDEDEDNLEIVQESLGEYPEEEDVYEEEENVELPGENTTEDIVYDENGQPVNNTPEETTYADISIAEAVGLDGFSIIYKNMQVADIFPEEESDQLVFSMQASPGMELLVVTFGITNETGESRDCDILNSGASFRALINGTERVNAQRTILLNDMTNFYEHMEGYGMVDAVLVFEVSKGTAETISTLDLIVRHDDSSTTHMLR